MKLVTYLFIVLTIAAMITGCYTSKKANKQLTHAYNKYPVVVASGCSNWFPVIARHDTTTQYIRGKDFYHNDTVVQYDDKDCPITYITSTLHTTDTFRYTINNKVVDSALIFLLRHKQDSTAKVLNDTNNKLSSSHKNLLLAILTGLISVLLNVWLFYKKAKGSKS